MTDLVLRVEFDDKNSAVLARVYVGKLNQSDSRRAANGVKPKIWIRAFPGIKLGSAYAVAKAVPLKTLPV